MQPLTYRIFIPLSPMWLIPDRLRSSRIIQIRMSENVKTAVSR
jgi:hypothetical protein